MPSGFFAARAGTPAAFLLNATPSAGLHIRKKYGIIAKLANAAGRWEADGKQDRKPGTGAPYGFPGH